MKASRLQRAVDSGLWAFAIVLLAASSWGFWRALSSVQQAVRQVTSVQQRLNRLENTLAQMEHSLLGLAHADSRKARFVGYDPVRLHAELSHAHREADIALRDLLATLSGASELDLQKHLIRLELKWAQTRSRLAEYLASEQPERVSLSTLRTFSFRGQGGLSEAIQEFRRVYQTWLEHEIRADLSALAGYVAGTGIGFGVAAWLMWRRWARPARCLQRALTQSGVESVAPAPLRGSEWEAIYQKLAFQERRLREAEMFMRDLAMGRIPEPITPTDPTDALARSSAWLLKRFEELRAEQREAV